METEQFNNQKENTCYNTHKRSRNRKYRNDFVEEPIDLTFSPNLSENVVKEDQPTTSNLVLNSEEIKAKGRKRKLQQSFVTHKPEEIMQSFHLYADYLQIADRKQAEVLRAAKSLFSKRTRTLYRWMYPHISKAQLKSAVASSWETLGVQEKEFYLSQILGKFGSPQSNLMVNPLLENLRGNQLQIEGASDGEENSGLLNFIHNVTHPVLLTQEEQRRGRLGRPPGSRNRKLIKSSGTNTCEGNPDEFHDDPELNQEFQQFSWTLQLNENIK